MNKVVFYIGAMVLGGAEKVINNLATYFCNRKVEVVLVNDFEPDSSVFHYDVDARVKRLYLQKQKEGNAIIRNISRLQKLRKIIKEERPDLVLSFLGPPNIRMLLSTIGVSVKKVVSVRNDPNREYGTKKSQKILANLIFRLADGVVFQTRGAQRYFAKSIQEKSEIIYNPVADVFFNTDYIGDEKNIISIGRLEPQKNNALLIKAFSQISDEYPENKLVFYGSGSQLGDLHKLSKDLNISSKIIFAGDTKNVPEALKHCSLFVLSSDYEGLPNALMEAMAVGVPCISTDCPSGGPKELIENGKDGILIDVGSLHELTEALTLLMNDKEKCLKLGEKARIKALKFRPEEIYSQWYDFFKKVIG